MLVSLEHVTVFGGCCSQLPMCGSKHLPPVVRASAPFAGSLTLGWCGRNRLPRTYWVKAQQDQDLCSGDLGRLPASPWLAVKNHGMQRPALLLVASDPEMYELAPRFWNWGQWNVEWCCTIGGQ